MIKEAEKLHKHGLSWKRMEELGLEYRYLALYLQKKISKEQVLTQLEAKIWQYSKRQMTYWRRNKDITWFDSAEEAFESIMRELVDDIRTFWEDPSNHFNLPDLKADQDRRAP